MLVHKANYNVNIEVIDNFEIRAGTPYRYGEDHTVYIVNYTFLLNSNLPIILN